MTKLESLWITNGEITDAGLVHLHKLTNLNSLTLMTTRVSDSGLLALKAALPSLTDADCLGSRPPLNPPPGPNGEAGQGGETSPPVVDKE